MQYKHTCFRCSCAAAPFSSTGAASTAPVLPPLASDAAAIPATVLNGGGAAGFFFGLGAVGAGGFFFAGFFFCFFGWAGAAGATGATAPVAAAAAVAAPVASAVAAAPSGRLRFLLLILSRTQSLCWLSALQRQTLAPMHRFHVPLKLRGRLQENRKFSTPCRPPSCPFRHARQLCDTFGRGAAAAPPLSGGGAALAAGAGAASRDRLE